MHGISKSLMVLAVSASLLAAQTVITYRLLTSRDSGSEVALREFDYNISVEEYLDVNGIKNVICRLIRSEKPSGYVILNFGVYYKLDRYIPETERDVADGARHREQRIAQYHWNKDSPKDSRRLVVSKDPKGKTLPEWRYYDFDHARSCR